MSSQHNNRKNNDQEYILGEQFHTISIHLNTHQDRGNTKSGNIQLLEFRLDRLYWRSRAVEKMLHSRRV